MMIELIEHECQNSRKQNPNLVAIQEVMRSTSCAGLLFIQRTFTISMLHKNKQNCKEEEEMPRALYLEKINNTIQREKGKS